ncbi:hypothetical protein BKA70DRAFT_357897 [Coprinopsis sp. MPI-PUGE-AT-0042]|nr:hypothetical protein BKA70DRAFT_357897 [Coprinopsis sp. MPI-PUGE-AT-0042]
MSTSTTTVVTQPVFPIEVVELIADEIGHCFIDHGGTDSTLRTALYNLSLSTCHLRNYCRRYLWHTLCVKSQNRGKPPQEFRRKLEFLYQTLSKDQGPKPCVRKVDLRFRAGADAETTWITKFLLKILAIFDHVDSLHLTVNPRLTFLLAEIAERVLECIQVNPLKEVAIDGLPLPSTFMLLLPISLKRLELRGVALESWPPGEEPSFQHRVATISLDSMRLALVEASYSTLAALPAAFFNNMRSLDMKVISHYSFVFLHKRVLFNALSLQELRAEWDGIPRDEWNKRSRTLPVMLQDASPPQNLTNLALVLRHYDATTCPPCFETLVNAYLSLELSKNINHFELQAFWCYSAIGQPLIVTPDCDWGAADRMLSDEEQFPNLNTVRLAFKARYIFATPDVRATIKASHPGVLTQHVEKLQKVKDAFSRTRSRGVDVLVSWEAQLADRR